MGALTKTHTLVCCGKQVDAVTAITGEKELVPRPGDFTICIYCGSWLRFVDADGTTRKFVAEDILDLTDAQREAMRLASHHAQALWAAPPPPDPPPGGSARPPRTGRRR